MSEPEVLDTRGLQLQSLQLSEGWYRVQVAPRAESLQDSEPYTKPQCMELALSHPLAMVRSHRAKPHHVVTWHGLSFGSLDPAFIDIPDTFA